MTLLEQIEKDMIYDKCERVFLFLPDGNKILFSKKTSEGKHEIRFSKGERKLCKGNVLTHSHTESGFGTFTPDDIKLFFSCKLKEIRMVKGNKVLSLVHKNCCNSKHSLILNEIALWDQEHDVSEDGMNEFLRGFSCLTSTKSVVIK